MQEQSKPKAKCELLGIKASSTRIVIDQSHKGFGNYNPRSPYNPMNKRGLYPMKLSEAQSIMVAKSPARDGSLAVLQLAAAPRDDEASGVAFLLCLTRMCLWMTPLDDPLDDSAIPPLDGGIGVFIFRYGRWFW